MMDFTTIFVSNMAWEVRLLQHALAGEDIPSFVADEHISSLNWLYAGAVGGVKLQVRTEDADRARRVLLDMREGQPAEDRTACPHCGSTNTVSPLWHGLGLILTLITCGIPLLFSRSLKCRDCGSVWKL